MQERIEAATGFLKALLGRHAAGYFTIWAKDRGKSRPVRWYDLSRDGEIEEAARYALALDAQGYDVYVSTCPACARGEDGDGRDRIKHRDVSGVPSFFMDCDVGKKNCPTSKDELREKLLALAVPPSRIVDSGNGYHAYWLLGVPISVTGKQELDQAKKQLRGFADGIAALLGWTGFDTFASEPAHVLRIPGTHNHKGAAPLPVGVVHDGGRLYALAELLPYVVEREKERRTGDVTPTGGGGHSGVSCQQEGSTERSNVRGGLTDEQIIAKARTAKGGDRFIRLYGGQWEGEYPSQSEADIALVNMLVFWAQGDEGQVDRLFRRSGLFRAEKWDKLHGVMTYGQMTIRNALGTADRFYEPDRRPAVHEAAEVALPPRPGATHTLVSLDQVTPTPPRYFWEPYIRLHNINLIRGDGGVGKTMLIMALAAAVTKGAKPEGMPGALSAGQGAVIYYGAEDDPSEYANRAVLCGCDRRYLHVVGEGSTLPHLSQLDVFRAQIRQTGAKLIVFDPIQSFLGATTDMNKANEVRPMLDGLRALCQEMGCTAIIIEHLNKATQQKAHYRGIGTVDIINACRSALMVGWHPHQKGLSVAVQIKANAKYGQPVAFSIDENGKFGWQGLCDATEDEVANARRFGATDTAKPVADPALSLVLALMEMHPEGWTGTAAQMLAEGSAMVDCSLLTKPESIGRRLQGIHHELVKRGISWTKVKREHRFSKRPQLSLIGTPNGDR